jgi:hypothetical protein
MEVIEQKTPTASPVDRTPMVVLYWMFNAMAPAELKRPGWEDFVQRWESAIDKCSIELVAVRTLWGLALEWPAEACAGVFDGYQRSRHQKLATNLPRLLEIAVMAEIANIFLMDGKSDQYGAWISRAILDAAGQKEAQDYLRDCRHRNERVDTQRVLSLSTANASAAPSSTPASKSLSEDDIRRRAYFQWEAAGRPVDDGVRFWLEAERELAGNTPAN